MAPIDPSAPLSPIPDPEALPPERQHGIPVVTDSNPGPYVPPAEPTRTERVELWFLKRAVNAAMGGRDMKLDPGYILGILGAAAVAALHAAGVSDATIHSFLAPLCTAILGRFVHLHGIASGFPPGQAGPVANAAK